MSHGDLERIARNEAVFRDANERIAERVEALGLSGQTVFLCECGDERCSHALRLTREEYQSVREDPARFVVAPGHAIPSAERVVVETERFAVVEKFGVGRDVALAEAARGRAERAS